MRINNNNNLIKKTKLEKIVIDSLQEHVHKSI